MSDTISLSDALGTPVSPEAVRKELSDQPEIYRLFQSFPSSVQEEILSFLSGQKGLEILYDRFFKHVFDCTLYPDRVEKLISVLLGQPIRIREVLPLEGSLLADKGTFVIMDILVELSDGSIVDVEMQKIGYQFPVQRTACYLSDIMMRQYNRVRDIRKKDFSYRDIKDVYLFIIMDESSHLFHGSETNAYIHRRVISYDSGIRLPEIAHVVYIALDIFRKSVQNVDTELDAWLTFFCRNDAASILELIKKYPEFLPYYHDIAEFRKDPKELIHMFSEALYILDKNTERLMVDELREERDAAVAERDKLAEENAALLKKIDELQGKH